MASRLPRQQVEYDRGRIGEGLVEVQSTSGDTFLGGDEEQVAGCQFIADRSLEVFIPEAKEHLAAFGDKIAMGMLRLPMKFRRFLTKPASDKYKPK